MEPLGHREKEGKGRGGAEWKKQKEEEEQSEREGGNNLSHHDHPWRVDGRTRKKR